MDPLPYFLHWKFCLEIDTYSLCIAQIKKKTLHTATSALPNDSYNKGQVEMGPTLSYIN
jgi:hypothetical protein